MIAIFAMPRPSRQKVLACHEPIFALGVDDRNAASSLHVEILYDLSEACARSGL